MKSYELALIIVPVVLILLLVIAYFIKRKCCTRSQNDRHLDTTRIRTTPHSSFSDGQSRQEHFDGTSTFDTRRTGSGRVNSGFVADRSRFHVENERQWPSPYFIRGEDDRWPPPRPQPQTATVNTISGRGRLVYNDASINNTQLPSGHFLEGRTGAVEERTTTTITSYATERRPSPYSIEGRSAQYAVDQRRPSYAAAATGKNVVGSERRRPRPYDGTALTPSQSQQRKAPVPIHQVGESSKKSKQKERQVAPPKIKKLGEDDTDINNLILAMQGNLREDSTPHETIGEVQKLLLLTVDSRLLSEDCRLIIGVDATPATQAGYCVNLKEKCLSYYVVRRDDLPWVLHNPKDPSEFEMKNFMFALTVWEDVILRHKRIRIYTDNFAITKANHFDSKKYGDRAFQVLHHLRECKKVTVLNINNMAVNRFKNLKQFAKYIQPADDLSRWQIGDAVDFLTKVYEIDQENVQGTHDLDLSHRRSGNAKIWYKPTEMYQQILNFAKSKIDCHDCPNAKCSGTDHLQASLRRSKSNQKL